MDPAYYKYGRAPLEGDYGYPTLEYLGNVAYQAYDKGRNLYKAGIKLHGDYQKAKEFTGGLIREGKAFRDKYGLKLLSRRRHVESSNTITRSKRSQIVSMKRRRGMDTRYTGKFPFPNKRAYKDKRRAPPNGSTGEIEGNIDALTAANTAYIGFSSFLRSGFSSSTNRTFFANPVFHMCVALLRKYFKREYNADIESIDQTWRDLNIFKIYDAATGADGEYPTPMTIALWYKVTPHTLGDNTTPVPPVAPYIDYIRPAGDNYNGAVTLSLGTTILTTAYNMARQLLDNYQYGAKPNSGAVHNVNDATYEFYGMSVLDYSDESGATVPTTNDNRMKMHKAIFRVDKMKIKIRTKNTIYIQNQTTSDANSLSTDVVDTNPVKGRIFLFKHIAPIVRYIQSRDSTLVRDEYKLMHDVNGDGVIYPDADVGGDTSTTYNNQAWGQIPSTDMFTNCKSFSNISLQPGEIKRFDFGFSYNGYINRFLQGLDLSGLGVSQAQNSYAIARTGSDRSLGTSVLFAFDKRLSTGSNGVELAVQRTAQCWVQLGKTKKVSFYPMRYREIPIPQDDTTVTA